MKDFWYLNPTKVIFGKDKLGILGEVIKPHGSKVLLVYGRQSARASGLLTKVATMLEVAGLHAFAHEGVKSNPDLAHVRDGIATAKREAVDCVLAVGGGSVIDAAKVIACGALTDRDVWEFFTGGVKPEKALPIFTVPTVAASGSEVNAGAVLTDQETGRKLAIGAPCLAPAVSILDPTLTLGVPRAQTMHGLVDACSHVMDGYFNGEDEGTLVQDSMGEGVLRSLIDIAAPLLADLRDYDLRAQAMWAACVAHNGLLNVGRGRISHEIHIVAHALGGSYDIPHGAAIGVVLPAWMAFREPHKRLKMARFATQVMGVSPRPDPAELATKGIQQFRTWLGSIGSPLSLRDLGLDGGCLRNIVSACAPVATTAGVPHLDEGRLSQLVATMLTGEPAP